MWPRAKKPTIETATQEIPAEVQAAFGRPAAAGPPAALGPAAAGQSAEARPSERTAVDLSAAARAVIEACAQELKADPEALRAARLHFEMARAYGAGDRAMEHYQKALELAPEHLPSLHDARNLHLEWGEATAAAALLDSEIRLAGDPRHKAALCLAKGRALQHLQDDATTARDCYARATELDGNNLAALKALEQCELQAGAWRELAAARARAANAVADDAALRAALLVEQAQLLEGHLDNEDGAVELYQRALDLDANVGGALGALKRLLHAQHRWRDLIGVLEREAAQAAEASTRALALYRVSQLQHERLGDRTGAIATLSRALQVAPRDRLILASLERLYEQAGDKRSLAGVLAHQVELAGATSERLALLQRVGELYEQLGDRAEARRWYEAALATDSCHRPALGALDPLYRETGEWEALITKHLAVAENSIDVVRRGDAHAIIGAIYEKQLGQPDQAIEHHAKALALAPQLIGSFKALTRLYHQGKRYHELIELYGRAIDDATETDVIVAYLFKIGTLYEDQLDDSALAARTYRRVLKILPEHLGAIHAVQRTAEAGGLHQELVDGLRLEAKLATDPARRLALLHRAGQVLARDLADEEAAIRQLREVLDEDPNHRPTLLSLGDVYRSLGRHEDLLQIHERELELSDDQEKVRLLYRMAQLCEHEIGDGDRAIGYYRAALALDCGFAPASRALCQLLRERGDFKGIATVIEREIEGSTSAEAEARAWLRMGEIYEMQLDDRERAAVAYERAFIAAPELRPAIDALARVRTELEAWRSLAAGLLQEAQRSSEPRLAIEALLRAGEVWRDCLSEPESAIAAFETVRASQPGNLAALLALESLYRQSGAWDKLAAIYKAQASVLQAPQARIAVLEELAWLLKTHITADDAGELPRVYQALLAIDGSNALALTGLEGLAVATEDGQLLAEVDSRIARSGPHPTIRAAHYTRLGGALEERNPPAAQQAYRTALELDRDSYAALRGLGRIAERLNDPRSAVEALQREVSWTCSSSRAAELLVRCARIHKDQLGDPQAAVGDAEQALERDGDNLDAATVLADLLAGDPGRLITLLTAAAEAAQRDESVAWLWHRVALLYADEQQDLAAALTAAKRLLRLQPQNGKGHALLGDLYMRNRQYREAADTLAKAMELGVGEELALQVQLQRGRLHILHLDEHQAALECLQDVLRRQPLNIEARQYLIRIHTRSGSFKAASESARELLRAVTTPAERIATLVVLGQSEMRAGNNEAASDALRAAIALDGPTGEAGREYRKLLGDSEPWDGYALAIAEYLSRVEGSEPKPKDLGSAYLELARVQNEKLGRVDTAVATLRAGLRACGFHLHLHLELAERLKHLGCLDEAIDEYRRILGHDPTQVGAWRGLAHVYHDGNRKLDAGIALAPLLCFNEANDFERSLARQRRVHPGWASPGSFDAQALQTISAGEAWMEGRLAALLGPLAETFGKLFPPELERYGVTERDRLREGQTHPLRELCDRLRKAFGIPELDLYIHHGHAPPVVLLLNQLPALLVSQQALGLDNAHLVFLLARPLTAQALGLGAAWVLPVPVLLSLVIAAVRAVDKTFGGSRPNEAEIAELQRQLQKTLSRRNRKLMESACVPFVTERTMNLEHWHPTLELTANRAAALLSGDLPVCLDQLRQDSSLASPTAAGELVRRSPAVADLLRFWASAPAMELRKKAGIIHE